MSNLFRPKYTKLDPNTGKRVTRQTKKWYGRYQDADGVEQRVPLCTDKTAAQAMLLKLMQDAERRLVGLIDPATDQLIRPITEHIEEYRTHLVANARSEKHVGETIRLIKGVVQECGYRLLADLQSGGDLLEGHLAKRRAEGSAHRTINADLVAVRSFCRWLLTKKRLREDPTLGLHRLNVEEDRRRERRPLTDDESQRLIDAAFRSTREFKGLTGKDRAVMYTLAQRTGLRRKELRSLKPGSFRFEVQPPDRPSGGGELQTPKARLAPVTARCGRDNTRVPCRPTAEREGLAWRLVASLGRDATTGLGGGKNRACGR